MHKIKADTISFLASFTRSTNFTMSCLSKRALVNLKFQLNAGSFVLNFICNLEI